MFKQSLEKNNRRAFNQHGDLFIIDNLFCHKSYILLLNS